MSLVASLNKLNNSVDFNINYDRLNFLLNKFDLSEAEFLEKAEIKKEQLTNPVSLSTLKKIDKLFNQGLSYYYEKEAIKEFLFLKYKRKILYRIRKGKLVSFQ